MVSGHCMFIQKTPTLPSQTESGPAASPCVFPNTDRSIVKPCIVCLSCRKTLHAKPLSNIIVDGREQVAHCAMHKKPY